MWDGVAVLEICSCCFDSFEYFFSDTLTNLSELLLRWRIYTDTEESVVVDDGDDADGIRQIELHAISSERLAGPSWLACLSQSSWATSHPSQSPPPLLCVSVMTVHQLLFFVALLSTSSSTPAGRSFRTAGTKNSSSLRGVAANTPCSRWRKLRGLKNHVCDHVLPVSSS